MKPHCFVYTFPSSFLIYRIGIHIKFKSLSTHLFMLCGNINSVLIFTAHTSNWTGNSQHCIDAPPPESFTPDAPAASKAWQMKRKKNKTKQEKNGKKKLEDQSMHGAAWKGNMFVKMCM